MELELVYNEETQEWEEKPEPFITIECETEEDFEFIGNAIAFYKKHLAEQSLTEPTKEEAQPDCTYNKNGHCIGQKLMPECDAKNCDRRK